MYLYLYVLVVFSAIISSFVHVGVSSNGGRWFYWHAINPINHSPLYFSVQPLDKSQDFRQPHANNSSSVGEIKRERGRIFMRCHDHRGMRIWSWRDAISISGTVEKRLKRCAVPDRTGQVVIIV